MNENQRDKIIAESWRAHALIEEYYLNNNAVKGDDEWPEKQRILLADMALHLLQTALNPGDLKTDKLKNNVFSILTIADQFLPKAKLDEAKEHIFSPDWPELRWQEYVTFKSSFLEFDQQSTLRLE